MPGPPNLPGVTAPRLVLEAEAAGTGRSWTTPIDDDYDPGALAAPTTPAAGQMAGPATSRTHATTTRRLRAFDDQRNTRSPCNHYLVHTNLLPPQADEDSMVGAVLSASRVLVAIAARSLSDAGEEVTLTQYRSLVILAARGPQGVAALAEAVAVTPPTASRLCDRLVRKGLVRRRTDRRDRRQVRVGLTEAGWRLVDTVTERRRREIAGLLASIPQQDQRPVAAALQQLAKAAGEVPEQDWSTGWDL